ncbi:hypothetical protein AHAS_Ahas19G0170500 [Arachis hypogaea]
MVAGDRAVSASKSHSQAEKRRRDRINAQLTSLRKLIPKSDKCNKLILHMDKAALLGSVIEQVKDLKRKAIEVSKVSTESDKIVKGREINLKVVASKRLLYYEFDFRAHDSAFKDRYLQFQNVRVRFIPTEKKDIRDISRGRSNSFIAKVAGGEEPFRVRDMQERVLEGPEPAVAPVRAQPAVEASAEGEGENLIGRGGFAEVYQGCLEEGKLIAVKKLTNGSIEEKTAGFLSELGVIAHVDHPNTAKIIGCCVERDMHLLVFSLSPLGSLGSLLHGPNKHKLDWSKRYKIALGIADGLLYLHENCHRRIIHRDIKAENILLTENFDPQICDFGLAKWLPEQWTHCNVTKIGGTFGYFAPEYCMHGIVDEKTDIFSFGVLLLEIISGRPALDDMQKSLVLWAKPLLEDKNIEALVDPSLDDDYDKDQVGHVVFTASKCVDQSPILRPCMSEVVTLLRGHDKCDLESTRKGQRKSLQRTYSEELLDAQEYNSTKYLRDLNRHRQLALGSCES